MQTPHLFDDQALNEMLLFDKNHIWHPYSRSPWDYPPLLIQKATGVYLYHKHGKMIDAMSSWWSVIHGYNHPILNAAITSQLDNMAHVMFGGLTHAPAIDLTKVLLALNPDMSAVFFADSGSVSVEVALKMAIQYQLAQQNPTKNKFASSRSGYHGDTWHAMSVCDPVTGMHTMYGGQLPVQYFVDAPPACLISNAIADIDTPLDDDTKKSLDDFFDNHHKQLAGFIIEPIVQGAGGMRFYSHSYLQYLGQLCHQYDVLLIVDEIATGFGRTGKMFAYEHANITPDIMTIGKGLSGGYMSFAAVLCNKKVQSALSDSKQALMHGPTFMANPLACAVSLASVKLCINNNTPQKALHIAQKLSCLNSIACHPQVKQVRVLGAIGVIELYQAVDMAIFTKLLTDFGIWVRPFGRLVYIMPAYVISDDELDVLCNQLLALLDVYLKKVL